MERLSKDDAAIRPAEPVSTFGKTDDPLSHCAGMISKKRNQRSPSAMMKGSATNSALRSEMASEVSTGLVTCDGGESSMGDGPE